MKEFESHQVKWALFVVLAAFLVAGYVQYQEEKTIAQIEARP